MVRMMRDTKKAMVTEWNENHRVGDEVIVRQDSGSTIRTRTASVASLIGGHTPVIWLEGISGCYALDRVTAV